MFDWAPAVGEGFSTALLQTTGAELLAGHRIEPIWDGAVFDVLEEEIRAARRSVHLIAYMWWPGEASERVCRALEARSAEGIACRIVVDPVGSEEVEALTARLGAAGCEVRPFNPLLHSELLDLPGRNHRKLLVADGRRAVVGGFGIRDVWLGAGDREGSWRDSHARVEGPAVRRMQVAFAQNWWESGGGLLPVEEFPPLEPVGPTRAAFLASGREQGATVASKVCNLVIAAARERLWIASAYFVPARRMTALLVDKQRQGVDVRILVPGPVHDVEVVRGLQRISYHPLHKAGISIWEYQPSMMHAKTMVADGRLVLIGSINLDPLSMLFQEEGSILADDPSLGERVERKFLEDLHRSERMHHRKGLVGRARWVARNAMDLLH